MSQNCKEICLSVISRVMNIQLDMIQIVHGPSNDSDVVMIWRCRVVLIYMLDCNVNPITIILHVNELSSTLWKPKERTGVKDQQRDASV